MTNEKPTPPLPKQVTAFHLPGILRDNLFVLQREITLMGIRLVQPEHEDAVCPLCGGARHEDRIATCDYRSVSDKSRANLRSVIVLASDTLARAIRQARSGPKP